MTASTASKRAFTPSKVHGPCYESACNVTPQLTRETLPGKALKPALRAIMKSKISFLIHMSLILVGRTTVSRKTTVSGIRRISQTARRAVLPGAQGQAHGEEAQ